MKVELYAHFSRFQIDQFAVFGVRNILRSSGAQLAVSNRHIHFSLRNTDHSKGHILRSQQMKYAPFLYSARINVTDKCISTSQILMEKSEVKLSRKEQLKKAVKDYGSTVIVFHITISLASLGFFYVLVSSGIDMKQIMDYFGVHLKFAQDAGIFVTAYAIHKLFAPIRLSITLAATPFIVRYLRNKGILKKSPI